MRMRVMASAMVAAWIATMCQADSLASSAAAPKAERVPTTFVVRFTVKAGRNAQFEHVMATLQGKLADAEVGNVYYDLYLPSVDSQTYVLIEHYKDAAAVTAHGQDPNTRAMAAAVKDLLDGPPSAERLILVSSKR